MVFPDTDCMSSIQTQKTSYDTLVLPDSCTIRSIPFGEIRLVSATVCMKWVLKCDQGGLTSCHHFET
jgi:hypothetical protein